MATSGIRVAVIEPGIADTPFWGDAGAPAVALEASAVAEAIAYVIGQPPGVDVNELLVRPVGQTI